MADLLANATAELYQADPDDFMPRRQELVAAARAAGESAALVPSVAARLVKLGARLHMQAGAGDAVALPDSAYENVAFTAEHRGGNKTSIFKKTKAK